MPSREKVSASIAAPTSTRSASPSRRRPTLPRTRARSRSRAGRARRPRRGARGRRTGARPTNANGAPAAAARTKRASHRRRQRARRDHDQQQQEEQMMPHPTPQRLLRTGLARERNVGSGIERPASRRPGSRPRPMRARPWRATTNSPVESTPFARNESRDASAPGCRACAASPRGCSRSVRTNPRALEEEVVDHIDALPCERRVEGVLRVRAHPRFERAHLVVRRLRACGDAAAPAPARDPSRSAAAPYMSATFGGIGSASAARSVASVASGTRLTTR